MKLKEEVAFFNFKVLNDCFSFFKLNSDADSRLLIERRNFLLTLYLLRLQIRKLDSLLILVDNYFALQLTFEVKSISFQSIDRMHLLASALCFDFKK